MGSFVGLSRSRKRGNVQVVINKCYGGFSLSREAFQRFREMGQPNAVAEDDPLSDGYVDRAVAAEGEKFGHDSVRRSAEATVRMYKLDRGGSYLRDIPRNDPRLVQIISELGAKANGGSARLKIIEIPDDAKWEVEEYDGMEWIAETHRRWG